MTGAQASTLRLLADRGPLTLRELARARGLAPISACRSTDALLRRNLVTVELHRGREVYLLTERGRRAA